MRSDTGHVLVGGKDALPRFVPHGKHIHQRKRVRRHSFFRGYVEERRGQSGEGHVERNLDDRESGHEDRRKEKDELSLGAIPQHKEHGQYEKNEKNP